MTESTHPPATTPSTPAGAIVPRAELVGISKRFGATQALDQVSLDLLPGEVHALVGENGAGKSTLVKILAGIHQPDSGTILLDGAPIQINGPARARALRIAVVHQEPRLFPDLTVAENVFIGHAPSGRVGTIDWRATRRAAEALFHELDVQLDVGAPVRGLSMADQQLIEIAKSLSLEARVLILDEPTASLSAHEVARLFAIVRRLRDRGVAILFVSHRLDEVFELCDRATVFRDGRHVTTRPTKELTTADLIRLMVGRAVSLFPKVETPMGDVLLEVDGLTRTGAFRDVRFSVRAGEILGFAGLVGAGRTEIARVLFGIDRRDGGTIRLGGKAVDFASPSAAMHAGIAYVPEDRHQEGLVLDFSIAQNVTLPILQRLFPRFLVRPSAERRVAREFTEQLNVRMTGVDQLVGALSGGNQQKVVLAKWLASKPRVLILDEPTRGIDIGAKVEVHRIVSELAASGLAVILISSDLPEVLAMSDRILVLHEGLVTAEIPHSRATEERVMFAATGSPSGVETEADGAVPAAGGQA
ncbi:MAG TPA: sugar ABC transporter ATP-binding protein [Candidatus Limnocylindrales bacterium]|nr:sugar ABC transporter ATP-binding protein [Candidatus Limnocylindrales bacterium]